MKILQAAIEKMCRVYEDQMNESKARVEELQRQLSDTNTQRARAQADSGIQTNYLLNKFQLNMNDRNTYALV